MKLVWFLESQSVNDKSKVILTLSGGGVRAMIFHAGVLLYLSENRVLENISEISTVSGGSLLTGLIYKLNGYKWPDSNLYQEKIYEQLKTQICSSDLQNKYLLNLLLPTNWQFLFSRANILAKVIEYTWGVNKTLGDLSANPIWSINGTTAENGKRFRFKHGDCGDYSIGYTNSTKFKLSEAMAMSAAFPGGIGPLVIRADRYNWKKRALWNDPEGSEAELIPQYKYIHLYDGGVYDNLGIEPYFDSGINLPKKDHCYLLVSDAGKPLTNTFLINPLSPFRFKRMFDLTTDQIRSLRVRSLMSYFKKNTDGGAYLMIGKHPTDLIDDAECKFENWQSTKDISDAANYSTNLKKVKEGDFDKISRHGYELAKVQIQAG